MQKKNTANEVKKAPKTQKTEKEVQPAEIAKSEKTNTPELKSKKAQSEDVQTKSSRFKPGWALTLAFLALALGLVAIFHASFFAAFIGFRPVLRSTVLFELEKQGADRILDQIVIERIVRKEARAQDIKAEQIDIDNEIAAIRFQFQEMGTSLDDALRQQNYTEAELRKQIELQILLEKLLGDKLDNPEETQRWIEEIKSKYNVRYLRYQPEEPNDNDTQEAQDEEVVTQEPEPEQEQQ